MEGDTKKTQGSNINTQSNVDPKTSSNNLKSTDSSVNFSSNDIGRTTVAHKEHTYFTNVKKSLKETLTKKRIIITSIIILLVIGAIIVTFFFISHQTLDSNNNPTENTSDIEKEKTADDKATSEQISQYAKEAGVIINAENENTEIPVDDNKPSRLSQIKEDLQATSTAPNTSEENRIEAVGLLTSIYASENQYLDAISIIEKSLTENEYTNEGEFSLLTNLVTYYEIIGDIEGYKSALQRIVANIDRSKITDNDITNFYRTELERVNNEH